MHSMVAQIHFEVIRTTRPGCALRTASVQAGMKARRSSRRFDFVRNIESIALGQRQQESVLLARESSLGHRLAIKIRRRHSSSSTFIPVGEPAKIRQTPARILRIPLSLWGSRREIH